MSRPVIKLIFSYKQEICFLKSSRAKSSGVGDRYVKRESGSRRFFPRIANTRNILRQMRIFPSFFTAYSEICSCTSSFLYPWYGFFHPSESFRRFAPRSSTNEKISASGGIIILINPAPILVAITLVNSTARTALVIASIVISLV